MRFSTIIASVFGIGYFPVASGTVMSIVAIPLAMIIARHGGGVVLVGASLITFIIGIWACGDHVRATGRDDPSECVIDELAGQWLACAGICLTPVYPSVTEFALAFILFRLFDILKPWPISAAEKLPGGLGVMADDMVAGLAAAIIAGALQYFRVV
ncbi:MAG TPA: phosphatidylglycerophosphatase A [Rhizomicrobium sp.]|jgi:phosphatidylglycerophosphatase A|nr:phosphatidylglycerophosphatase A [Rhizomicrobium sp.]